jgi:hypothetical protein
MGPLDAELFISPDDTFASADDGADAPRHVRLLAHTATGRALVAALQSA